MRTGYAFFVKNPRTIEELLRPHLLEQERQYEAVRTIELSRMDYENFITDMRVERQYVEDNEALCERGEIWRCLLIRQRDQSGGVLVIPEHGGYIGWAALASEESLPR